MRIAILLETIGWVGFEVKQIQGYPQKNETSETTVLN